VQDVMGGLADSGGLLGVFVRQWHCVEGRVQPGAQKKPIESRVPPGAHGRTRWGVATR
jgi:hypothetical protein